MNSRFVDKINAKVGEHIDGKKLISKIQITISREENTGTVYCSRDIQSHADLTKQDLEHAVDMLRFYIDSFDSKQNVLDLNLSKTELEKRFGIFKKT